MHVVTGVDISLTMKESLMKKLLAATVVALIPLAALAGEDTKAPVPATNSSQGGSFEALDANKDGRISMPEASADPKLVEGFSAADKNADGYLDSTEYANNASAPPQK
jgi:hypothetical protein